MSSPNEISSLQKIMVKPSMWRITQQINNTYQLEFTYRNNPDILEFAPVLTRRNGTKIYKSLNTLFKDIEKVQSEAVIQYASNVQ